MGRTGSTRNGKSTNAGLWKVPIRKKDYSVPKRPPKSAFRDFAIANRSHVRLSNPHLKDIELSIALAKKWKEAPAAERAIFIDKENEVMEQYRANMRARNEVADVGDFDNADVETGADTAAHRRNLHEDAPVQQDDVLRL
eukprot:scaffold178975_cov61-Attheya_sp.AAC.1